MKKAMLLLVLISFILIISPTAYSDTSNANADFSEILNDHGAIMLIIEPGSGSILYANNAASSFYGHTKDHLLTMKISEINTLTPEETEREMQRAANEQRNYFVFKHRLANQEIRSVEVFSYPVNYEGTTALFSIIHDITDKEQLEQKEKKMTGAIIFFGSLIIVVLLFLFGKLMKTNRNLKESKNILNNFYQLRKTFIDADENLVYLKDENLKYVFVNQAMENFYQKPAEEFIGLDDYGISDKEFAQLRRDTDLEVLEKECLVVNEITIDGRIYKTTKFPVPMLNGRFGVGAYITNITKEREHEKKQEKNLHRHIILTDVLTRSFKDRQEQLDFVLHEALKLTESQYGYIYLYDENKREFTINSWTKGVMKACEITEKQTVYQLDQTGIWGEVIRQRLPIIINDFQRPDPLKKGYPEGHVPLKKFMSIPVIIDEKIVAVVGLANKIYDYDEHDVYEMTVLLNGAWNAVERREALERLSFERNKYLKTLISIGDGILVVDKDRKIEMLNNVAERLTGWSNNEAYGRNYKEVFVLSHEQKDMQINDPIEKVFQSDTIQEMGNHAVLTSRDGTRYYLEDSAAPIKDDQDTTVGVILVFRDVTDKKEQRRLIEYLSFHDSLTGLYNRRFFEEEMQRLDTERNLPLSIIMGDVNGLKLTNDIFGHSYGDSLLNKVADVLHRICRADDIIARWGGDEFVLLLPKTNLDEAELIIKRLKREVSKEQVKAIKGSLSFGAETKTHISENIVEVLDRAEEKMYATKILERDEFSSGTINSIIDLLHENNIRENEHSVMVSELSRKMGKTLNLPDIEIKKLKDAAYLHDIGKIVLDAKLMKKKVNITDHEWNEIKKHPVIGYRILNSFDQTLDLAEIVLAHQERWDGSGYPKGLKGKEIPLLARIIALAESYDRKTAGYDNSAPMSREEALKAMENNAGKHFDPLLTEIFINMMQKEEQDQL